MRWALGWGLGLGLLGSLAAGAGAQPAPAPATPPALPPGAEAVPGTFLLTVFLRYDQSKTVDEINAHLKATGWYEKFPGAGIEIVS